MSIYSTRSRLAVYQQNTVFMHWTLLSTPEGTVDEIQLIINSLYGEYLNAFLLSLILLF